MKLYCKSAYANAPAGLFFDSAGVFEVNESQGAFLLRDAPDNFSRYEPSDYAAEAPLKDKALDDAPADKMLKAPIRKKGAK